MYLKPLFVVVFVAYLSGATGTSFPHGIFDFDNNEDDREHVMPWMHHVDFDERHPGEEMTAVESEPFVRMVDVENGGGSDEIESYWNPFPFFRNPRPWWKGSNVCVERLEEDNDDEENSSDEQNEGTSFIISASFCDEKSMSYKCVKIIRGPGISKNVTTTYKCCKGYYLSPEQNCVKGSFENVLETIDEIGGSKFVSLVKQESLDRKLATENLTVFVPSNDAVQDYIRKLKLNEINRGPMYTVTNEIMRRRRSVYVFEKQLENDARPEIESISFPAMYNEDGEENYPDAWSRDDEGEGKIPSQIFDVTDETYSMQKALLNHMTSGSISTDEFVDEQVVFSQNQDSALRFNTWNVEGEKVNTVNCAKLTSINHICTNGMVHMVDRMIKPAQQSIANVINKDGRLSILRSLLYSSGLMTMFEDPNVHYTLFAPTDDAFAGLEPEQMERLRRDTPCLKRIMRQHVLPFTFCSCVATTSTHVRNIDNEVIELTRDDSDNVFVNGSKLLEKDVVATNGAVQILDQVLMPESAKPVSEVMKDSKLTSYLNAVTELGLKSTFDDMFNITLFVPTNEAMESLPEEIRNDKNKFKDVIMHHVIEGEVDWNKPSLNSYHSQESLDSQRTNLTLIQNFDLIFESGHPIKTVQCAKITKTIKSCNGAINVIDNALVPTKLNIYRVLDSQKDLSIFRRLLEASNVVLEENKQYTVFAPTNDAFPELYSDISSIMDDQEQAYEIVKGHIIEKPLCCAGVVPKLWFLTRKVVTLGGQGVEILRNAYGEVEYGNTRVTSCDLVATNGVIHTIDSVMTEVHVDQGSMSTRCLFSHLFQSRQQAPNLPELF